MKSVRSSYLAQSGLVRGESSPADWSADSTDVFLPEGFEKNYAYPVLIWLDSEEGCRGEFQLRMEAISERNYVGIRFPVSEGASGGLLLEEIPRAVRMVSRYANLHSERIYLCGERHFASLALQHVLAEPGKYGGFVAVAPAALPATVSLGNYRRLKHLRGLFLERPGGTPSVSPLASLLHASGVEIRQQGCPVEDHASSGGIINRFLMQGILREQMRKA